MKISSETYKIFTNYATINDGLVIEEPTCMKTINKEGSIISIYDTQEKFPLFAIWDFRKFNSLIEVMGIETCDFDFQDNCVIVSSGSRKIKYEYTDMSVLVDFEQLVDSQRYKNKVFDGFTFDLLADDIREIKKVNSIFQFSEDILKIEMNDGKGMITVFSEANETNSNYSLEIDGEGSGIAYTKIDNLKIISGDYKCSVSNDGIIKYQNKTIPLIYFIRTVDMDR